MEKRIKRTFIILWVIFVVAIIGSTVSFVMYFKGDSKGNSNEIIEGNPNIKPTPTPSNNGYITGDIVFNSIDDSIHLDKAIPTLDKFGVMGEPFSFTIKNTSRENTKYTLKLVDDASTIKNSYIRYELTKNNKVLGVYTLADDGVLEVSTIKSLEEISYSIKIWLDYNSDVKIGRLSKRIAVSTESGSVETEYVNSPVLTDGMIPVIYNSVNNNWVKCDVNNTDSNEWYNYGEQKWANAVTVNSEKRNEYMSSPVGTVIPIEDINAFFVWIPRFKYSGDSNNINVTFVDTRQVAYPAFKFNDNELEGFWISKFENGMMEDSDCAKFSLEKYCNDSNNKLYYVPNYLFINRMTMANQFYAIRKMELANNIYGFKSSATKLNNDGSIKNDDNNIDTHMVKNIEWQAVALLSSSKYGKTGNNNYSSDAKMITNNGTNYTGKATFEEIEYDYNVALKGEASSTTGTVYGVYDMTGGKREYVMFNNEELDIFNKKSNSGFTTKLLDYYYDNGFTDSDTTTLYQEKYSKDNLISSEPITRGGFKNTGNIFNVYSAQDYIDKISLETNSRAILVVIKEK